MPNNSEDFRTIDDWSKEFETLYKKHDKVRKPEGIWLSTLAYCSMIGEAVRRVEYEELLEKAAHAFCWLCTFVTKLNYTDDPLFKLNHNFCDIVYFKFPDLCGHCKKSECRCDPFKMDNKPDKAAEYIALYEIWKKFPEKIYCFSDWIKTFQDIYGGRIYLQTLENICFHFLEEAGEEAQAIRELIQMRKVLVHQVTGIDQKYIEKSYTIEGLVKEYEICMNKIGGKHKINILSNEEAHLKARIIKAKMDLVVEFADTFSWFCAILIKLRLMANNLHVDEEKYNIDNYLEKEYGKKGTQIKCPTCQDADCKCLFYH